jgi:hypothetical protein
MARRHYELIVSANSESVTAAVSRVKFWPPVRRLESSGAVESAGSLSSLENSDAASEPVKL